MTLSIRGSDIRKQLERFGSDTERAHPIDFYFYLKDERLAYLLAAELQRNTFDVTVEPSGADQWLCLARKYLIPNETALESLLESITRLSTSYEAEFDGWESEIIF